MALAFASASGGGSASGVGSTSLVYRYTVTGADKTSIDTGVDAAEAGSNDWTNGDVLEVWVTARTDKAVVSDEVDVTFNNDGSAIYDRENLTGAAAAATASSAVAEASLRMNVHGASGGASYPSVLAFTVPDYSGTTFWKVIEQRQVQPDSTAANEIITLHAHGYRSTSAIARLALTAIGGQKLKVGSQLLIYKRLAS